MAKANNAPQVVSSLDDLRVDEIKVHVAIAGLPPKTVRLKPLTYHDWQMTALEVEEPQPPDKWTIKDGKKTKDGKDLENPEYQRKRQEAHMERQYRRLLKALLGVPGQFDELRGMDTPEQLKTLQESAFMGYTMPLLAKLSQLALEGYARVDTLAATFPAVSSDTDEAGDADGQNG